jgi:hypothetical protein
LTINNKNIYRQFAGYSSVRARARCMYTACPDARPEAMPPIWSL